MIDVWAEGFYRTIEEMCFSSERLIHAMLKKVKMEA
jgi:hypothetical protein